MIKRVRWLFLFVAVVASAVIQADQTPELAIQGYDPVAYFTEGSAKTGSAEYSTLWQGKAWRFSSQYHLEQFQQQPERYAPQFLAYCANGLSDGHLIKANPKIFRIIDGRLYLFYSWWGRAQWKYKQQAQIEQASDWWQEFKRTEVINYY